MKVILLETIPALGQEGEVKEVADGYATNYLLPNKKALLATGQNVSHLKAVADKHQADSQAVLAKAAKIRKILEEQTLEFSGKVSEKDNLFSAIHNSDIIGEIKKKFGVTLDEKWFGGQRSFKHIGEYKTSIYLPGNQKFSINIKIKPATN